MRWPPYSPRVTPRKEPPRDMIVLEELHLDEVNKMLRKPGAIEPFKP